MSGHAEATTILGVHALVGPLYVAVGVLVIAGAAKIARPSATATALRELRVPAPLHAARILGAAEIVVGITTVLTGATLALVATGILYVAFTGFIFVALATGGSFGSCGCFGSEETPPTIGHGVFNAVAAAVALLLAADGSAVLALPELDGSATEIALVLVLVVVGTAASVLALTAVPRNLALATGQAAPAAPQFRVGGSPGGRPS